MTPKEFAEKIISLQDSFDRYPSDVELLAQSFLEQEQKLAIAKEALGFYADPAYYVVQIHYDDKMKPISSFNPMSEKGTRARKALEELGR